MVWTDGGGVGCGSSISFGDGVTRRYAPWMRSFSFVGNEVLEFPGCGNCGTTTSDSGSSPASIVMISSDGGSLAVNVKVSIDSLWEPTPFGVTCGRVSGTGLLELRKEV